MLRDQDLSGCSSGTISSLEEEAKVSVENPLPAATPPCRKSSQIPEPRLRVRLESLELGSQLLVCWQLSGLTGAPGSHFFTTVIQRGSHPKHEAKCSLRYGWTEMFSEGTPAQHHVRLGGSSEGRENVSEVFLAQQF